VILAFSLSDGGVQALATVIAVFVGFLLSALAERRAWERRKVEQIRDRQINSVLGLSRVVDEFLVATENVDESALATAYLRPGSAVDRARQAEASKRARALLTDLEIRALEVRRLVNELKVLGFRAVGLAIAGRCLERVERVIEVVASDTEHDQLDEARIQLREAATELVDTAISGLHG